MHAAPVLRDAFWAAIPLLVARVDLADAWSEEEVSQAIDWQFERILDAYSEATGCRRETILATTGIEQVMSADWFTFVEANKRAAFPEFDTVPDVFTRDVSDAWKRLGKAQKEYALERHIDWRGFSPDQEAQIIRNVIAGRPKEEWFAGVGSSAGHGASPLTVTDRECEQHHSRGNGHEKTYDKDAGDWMQEMADWPVIEANMKDKLPIANEEPAGTYQIWHRDGDAYRHVANVEAGNYMAAVVLPMFKRGTPETERVTWLVEPARPTTFGDKFVDPLGAAYEIYKPDFGGIALRQTSIPEARPLASHQVTPSAEPARPLPGDQSPHPWPSQIAQANRLKKSEQDQGKSNEKAISKDTGHSI
jgi:hypothetical protein